MLRSRNMAVVAVCVLGLAGVTSATPVTAVDFGGLLANVGSLNAGPVDSQFATPPPTVTTIGTLRANVYYNDATNVYTYVYQVQSRTPRLTQFSSGFIINDNFNGVAGWMFAESLVAGGSGTGSDFNIDYSADRRLTWNTNGNWFGFNDVVTFFFQLAGNPPAPQPGPGPVVTDPDVGQGGGDTIVPSDPGPSEPVHAPEPASLAMLALGAAAVIRRRSRR